MKSPLDIAPSAEEAGCIVQIDYKKYNANGRRYISVIKSFRSIFGTGLLAAKLLVITNLTDPAKEAYINDGSIYHYVFIVGKLPVFCSGNEKDNLAENGITFHPVSHSEKLMNHAATVVKGNNPDEDQIEKALVTAVILATRAKKYGLAMKIHEILLIDFGHAEES